jgi:hypothetical protein
VVAPLAGVIDRLAIIWIRTPFEEESGEVGPVSTSGGGIERAERSPGKSGSS